MKNFLTAILFLTFFFGVSAFAQTTTRQTTATGYGAALPATCVPSTKTSVLFFVKNDGLYQCLSANTWAKAAGPAGPAGPAGAGGAIFPSIKIANDFAGVDIGAKINAADAALGTLPGEIWVFGDQTMTTTVFLSSRHKLLIHEGTITTRVPANQPPFYLKDNSSMEGTGWNSIIVEHDASDDGILQYFIIKPYNTSLTPTGIENTERADNITVNNLHFKGVRTNPHDSGIRSTVFLGNCHSCRVTNNWFEETSGYAAQFGGNPATYQKSADGYFTGNLMTNLMSQNLAIISADGMHIEGNTFRDTGKRPYRITAVSLTTPVVITLAEPSHAVSTMPAFIRNANPSVNGERTVERIDATHLRVLGTVAGTNDTFGNGEIGLRTPQGSALDIEPNGYPGREPNHAIIIRNNTFDLRNTTVQFSAISYQMAALTPNEGVIIDGNTLLGGDKGTSLSTSGILMEYSHAHGVIISNNYIKDFSQYGMRVGGDRLKIHDNYIVNCGTGGIPAFLAQDLRNSDITNNRIQNVFDTNEAGNGSPPTYQQIGSAYIFEQGYNTNNNWRFNQASLLLMVGSSPNFEWSNSSGTWRTESSTYTGNQFYGGGVSGLDESSTSNFNTFINNVTDLPDGTATGLRGMKKRGANSKVVSHIFTDGSIYIPTIRTVMP
jgi:hypothetical protein